MSPARPRPFAQVDVFAATPLLGNPVAVVLDGAGLTTDRLQQLASWTNLSETTAVLPAEDPAADYRLRIFTPGGELPFAGHPTLGSARAWLEHGGVPKRPGRVVQECGAGLVEIRVEGDELAFAAPPTVRTGPLDDELLARVVAGLGIDAGQVVDHQWVDNGPGWVAVRVATAAEVLAIEPDPVALGGLMVGVVGAHPGGAEHTVEVRAFAPGAGIVEDPVTGSLNASLAQWLIGGGVAPRSYRAAQGARVGRAGSVQLSADPDGTVWVGGAATVLIRGEITL